MSKERQGGGSWPQIGRKSRSSSSGPTKNGVKLVSYCGQCKQEVDPRFTSHTSLSGGEKFGRCSNGHVWRVRW